jgi:hypothetical protein
VIDREALPAPRAACLIGPADNVLRTASICRSRTGYAPLPEIGGTLGPHPSTQPGGASR